MDMTEFAVLASSALAAAGILLFFFGPRRQVSPTRERDGMQEIDLTVDGGYRPDRIVVRAGVPLRLNVLRVDRSSCTEQIAFRDFGVLRQLPTGRIVPITLPALEPGSYEFACGMNMVRGRIVAEG